MLNLVLIMLILPLIGCCFVCFSPENKQNAYYLSFFTLATNIVIILKLFTQIDISSTELSLLQTIYLLDAEQFQLNFGLDAFSLILILGVYIALIIGLVGLNNTARKSKPLFFLTLYFTGNITAFFVAGDLFSFYVFFAGMLIPLFMLVGAQTNKKTSMLLRFFIYNLIGSMFLLVGALILYKFYHGNVKLEEIALLDMSAHAGILVWTMICLAFISRIPVWPFHSWISSVFVNIKNPLIYIMINMLPLTGLYGFVRFWPLAVPESIYSYLPWIEFFAALTMLFIALIGFAGREFTYKLFSYTAIYYVFFLLMVILPVDTLIMNIAYSLFIFLIVTSSLVVLDLLFEEKCLQQTCSYNGILTYMPRFSLVMSFFVLTAVGLPISSLFWNNFVLVSGLFRENFVLGLWVMGALTLVSASLLQELYVMRNLENHNEKAENMEDLSLYKQVFFAGIVVVLFLSFFNPLWFVL